ncbi:MAG TPA: MarR family transcriptional regulator [Phycisphaerae bacterium]|nr:MarR family transcriptional regulator [Phycisphaerae bacterium]
MQNKRLQPGSPAERIVSTLLRCGPMTVAELVEALGVTTTAVTVQVSTLLAEGWLVRTQRRGGPGRPASVYAVSDRARQLLADEFAGLSQSLIEELFASVGAAQARRILRGVARRMAREWRGAAQAASTEERLKALVRIIRRHGGVVEGAASGHSLTLNVFSCPYPGLAEKHREICELDQQVISEVLGTAVQHEHCMLDGHRCCEFTVRK